MKPISILGTLVLFSFVTSAAPVAQKTLKGHVLPNVRHMTPVAHVSSTQQLRLAIGLSLPKQEQLTTFLGQLYDPSSPNYHQYLTPQEFTEHFGPSESDYQAVIDFATTSGFKILKTHPNRMLVDVVASAAQVEKAFGINLQVYQHPTGPRTFYAPDREPSVPVNLAIADISGLNDYAPPQPKNLKRMSPEELARVRPNAGSGKSGLYQGNDFRAAYAPGVSLTGTGQTVALLEFDGYNGTDITNYESISGISPVPLQNILIDGFNGSAGGNNIEVALDIEMVAAMAPGVSSIQVYEGGPSASQNDILNQMVTDNQAKQISSSWSWTGGPQTSTDHIFQEMEAQGQTYFNAAGDGDAFAPGFVDDPSHTNAPASNPYITQVGGTELSTTGPGGSWTSETVWNSGGGEGGSGGISSFYSIPSWQTNINMSANGGSTTMRNIPDVALTAFNISAVFTENGMSTNTGVGGTSCAAPLWAAFTALINQQAASRGKPPVGFLNPAIYAIGEGANYTTDFHDITTGNNFSPSSPTNFSATTGYDLCTGWGTPNGINLINALMPDDLSISPPLGFSATGNVGGPFAPTSLNLTLTNTGAAPLNWSLASNSSWLGASPGSGSLTPGGPATTVTVSLTPNASTLPGGNYSGAILFTNLNNNVVQNIPFNLSVLLVVNGGFETGDFTGWTLVGTGYPYNLVTASNATYEVSPHSGTYIALLGEMGSLSSLYQSIPTTPGGVYLASFWFLSDGAVPNEFQFDWNGQTLFDQIDVPATTFGWTNMQFIVQATANNTILNFATENDNGFFALDDVSVTPVPAAVLKAATLSGNSLQFSWNSMNGIFYQLQYSTNLSAGWSNLGNSISATGPSTSTSTPIGPDPQRFYRLQLLP